jgi:hypothetical protein
VYHSHTAGTNRVSIFTASGALSNPSGSVIWDGRDDAGRPVPSGAYFCRLETEEGESASAKLFFIQR